MSRPVFSLLVSLGFLVGPAMADKRLVAEGRHPTAKERRAGREKIEAQLEKDGFGRVPRIVGGRSAADGEYPWMVGLIDATEPDAYEGIFCGGSLVHPSWVLTAAHCVLGSRAEEIEVLVGATHLSNPGAGARRIAVAEIVRSPGYNDFTMDADFALLRLAEPADGTVIPLIDDPELELPWTQATVTGWGDTTNGQENFPTRLQEVELPIMDLEVANATPAYAGTLTGNMLAAGLDEGGKDSCQGDSGGPLIVPSPVAPGWMQAGVVSFGLGCAEPGNFGIYTRVSNFRDFITGHLRPNYAAWEQANGRRGESRDPDDNGRTNWEEFALPEGGVEKVVAGDVVKFSYVRPWWAYEVDYVLENAPTAAGPWTAMPPVASAVEDLGDGLSRWTSEFPVSADTGVFRLRAGFAKHPVRGPRPLHFPSGATGQLDPEVVAVAPTDIKAYRLEGLAAGQKVALTLRSADFDAGLRLVDAATFQDIASSFSNNAGGQNGTDERLEFTAEEGIGYWVMVDDGGEGGEYELNAWDPEALAALPPLSVTRKAATKGSLSAADPLDPLFLPGSRYFKDDFRLDTSALAAGRVVELRMRSKGRPAQAIDDFLSLIDAESGRLVAANDDFAGRTNDAGLRFIPVPGKSYLLRATSSLEEDVGNYQLTSRLPVAGARTSPLGAIGIGASKSGKLGAASELDERYFTFKRDYLLEPVAADQGVLVTLASSKFDAYLIVLDAASLAPVTEGDAGGPPGGRDNAKVEFTARAGRCYLLRATTYDTREVGAFVLKTSAAP